jgi:hypothetical protein|uniref:Uncharacterized protein n=1 Tax=Populus trichocarpa TaxID=3694 RepID=B9HAM4_POPTR
MELEIDLLTASSDDDDTCDEVFLLLASSIGKRKADFGTASDPVLAKIIRHDAITRTTNNLIAPMKKTLDQIDPEKNKRFNLYLKSNRRGISVVKGMEILLRATDQKNGRAA